MKKIHTLLATMGLLSITSSFISISYAQNVANSLTFSLGAGTEFFAKKRHLNNVTEPYIAAGYNFTDQWGIEALWGTFKTNFSNKTPTDRQVSGTLVLVDALYHFNPGYFIQPYLMAGVGVTGLSPSGSDATNEGNINAGLGVQFFANKIVAFRLDARDIYTMIGGKNDIYLSGGVTFLIDLC